MPASSRLYSSQDGGSRPETTALNTAARNALRHYQQLLVEKLHVQSILPSLRSSPAKIVTPIEHDRLTALTDKNAQAVTMLVSILKSKTQLQWNGFLAVLRQYRDYQGIADKLEKYEVSSEEILVSGGVPTFSNLVRREDDVKRVHEALRQTKLASQPTRVVLIHGKGGFGKTSLAADALRSCRSLRTMFDHGVIWASASHIRDEKRSSVDEPIKQLMEDILKHPVVEAAMDFANATVRQQPQTTFRQVKDQLRNALLNCDILLTLDDVWHEDVLKAFAGMRITILTTSRNRLAIKQLTPANSAIKEVEVKPRSAKEADAIFRSTCPIENKNVLKRVIDRCQGSPIALNTVASLLRGKETEQQPAILDKLDANLESSAAVRIPNSEHKYFDQVLEASLRDLGQTADLQIGQTSLTGAELLQRYLDLAVFDYGEPLFSDKFAVLLCTEKRALMPPKQVDQVLEYLEKRSLLTKTGQTHWKSKQDIYVLHDMQLDFLRIRASDPTTGSLTARHKQWVSGFIIARRLGDVLKTKTSRKTKKSLCCGCASSQSKKKSGLRQKNADDDDDIQWNNLSSVIRKIPFGGKWYQCYDPFSKVFIDGSDEERNVLLPFIHEKDELQWTALHAAAYEGNRPLAELLLKQRADPNARTEKKSTPLHFASQNGHLDMVELLIKYQADVNAQDAQKITPLHLASQNGHFEVAELLLTHNADAKARSEILATPLHFASQNGHRKVAELLLTHHADANAATKQKLTPLHVAAQNGHRGVVELLLANQADAKALASQQITPLHLAAMNGHRSVVEQLLKANADPNALATQKYSPLHFASQNGHRDVAELLLKQNADIRALTTHKQTALYLASENGYRDVVELLLSNYADINARAEDHIMPLHIASQNGHRGVVELLLKCHANINALIAQEFSSLHLAAQDGHRDVAELLLRNNADVNALTTHYFTPLHLASQNGHCNVAELLLSYRADINAPATHQFTPLHLAAQDGHCEVAELLSANRADISARTVQKFTPLHIAAQNGHRDVAELLIRHRANVGARTRDMFTPLHLASQDGHFEVAELLLANGADANASSAQQFTPLHLAAQDGHLEMVKLLLAQGVDVNARTEKKSTPLHFACLYGQLEIVQLLLDHQADINALNLFGCTPLSFAMLNNHGPIASLLCSRAGA